MGIWAKNIKQLGCNYRDGYIITFSWPIIVHLYLIMGIIFIMVYDICVVIFWGGI
jgi:hypothetical protein